MGGLRAHNRWLADFCGDAPGRRAGICQIMLHDVEGSVSEIRWAAEAGLTGGVLLPGAPPGSDVPPLYAPEYEPIWSVCEELGLPINHHSGSAAPDYGDYPAAQAMFLLEVVWWAHRTLWHLIFSGVMERHPNLQFVFTEQGTAWLPEEIARLDYYHHRLSGAGAAAGSQESKFGGAMGALSLKPSEYWARQCQLGSSFIRAAEVPLRDQVGVERIMWGSDFPHLEGVGRTPTNTSAWPLRAYPPTRFGPWWAATQPGSTASTLMHWRRWRPDLDRPSLRWPSPLASRTFPTIRCAARPSHRPGFWAGSPPATSTLRLRHFDTLQHPGGSHESIEIRATAGCRHHRRRGTQPGGCRHQDRGLVHVADRHLPHRSRGDRRRAAPSAPSRPPNQW